jgi:hypothetical protein
MGEGRKAYQSGEVVSGNLPVEVAGDARGLDGEHRLSLTDVLFLMISYDPGEVQLVRIHCRILPCAKSS